MKPDFVVQTSSDDWNCGWSALARLLQSHLVDQGLESIYEFKT